jgi:isoquinoline 1-oxidoreductase subunit beta
LPTRPTVQLSRTAPTGLGRRRFLGYVLALPTLTLAARIVGDPGVASAAPGIPDAFHLGDFLIVAGTPTAYDLSIEVTEQDRVVVRLPRIET